MFTASAVSVANIYYCQPLLSKVGESFAAPDRAVAWLPMWTQAGVALGMLAFVPLGDMFPRRKLICMVSTSAALMAALMAIAPNLALANAASFGIGLTAIVAHLILPFAAKLAPPERRGQVLGKVMSGVLLGVLLGRVVSGFLGDWLGWRAVYWFSAAGMFAVTALAQAGLPFDQPDEKLRYRDVAGSLGRLVMTQPVLREAAVVGAMLFGAFSSFWTTLAFLLTTPPFHYGASVAGAFGVLGAVSVLFAPWIGRLTDRRGPAFTVTTAILTTAASFGVLYLAGHSIAGLVAGVVLLDVGVQAGHVANQTRIYPLLPAARSRLNTVYMVTYFLGGALGSALGAYGWAHGGWAGVCLAGAAQLLVALTMRTGMQLTQR